MKELDKKVQPQNNDATSSAKAPVGRTLFVLLGTNPKRIGRQLIALGTPTDAILSLDAHGGELTGPVMDANGQEVHVSLLREQTFIYENLDGGAIRRAHHGDPATREYAGTLVDGPIKTSDGAGDGGPALAAGAERVLRSSIRRFLGRGLDRFLDRGRFVAATLEGRTASDSCRVVIGIEGVGNWGRGTLLPILGHILALLKHRGVEVSVEWFVTTPSTASGRCADQPVASFASLMREIKMLVESHDGVVSRGFNGNDLHIPSSPVPLVRLIGSGNGEILFDREDRCDMMASFFRAQELSPSPAATFFHNNPPSNTLGEFLSGVGATAINYDPSGAKETIAAVGMCSAIDWIMRDEGAELRPPTISANGPTADQLDEDGVARAKRWAQIEAGLMKSPQRDAPKFADAAIQFVSQIHAAALKTGRDAAHSALTDAKAILQDWVRDSLQHGAPAVAAALDQLADNVSAAIDDQQMVTEQARKGHDDHIRGAAKETESLRASKVPNGLVRLLRKIRAAFGGAPAVSPRECARQIIARTRRGVPSSIRRVAADCRLQFLQSIKSEIDAARRRVAEMMSTLSTTRANSARVIEQAETSRQLKAGFAFRFPSMGYITEKGSHAFAEGVVQDIGRQAIRTADDPNEIAQRLSELIESSADSVEIARDLAAYLSADDRHRRDILDAVMATLSSTLPITIENRPDRSRPRHRVVFLPLGQMALRGILEPRLAHRADHIDWVSSPFQDTVVITEEVRNLAPEDVHEVLDHDTAFDNLSPDYRRRFASVFSPEAIAVSPLIRRGLNQETAGQVAAEALALGIIHRDEGFLYRDQDGNELCRGYEQLTQRLVTDAAFAGDIDGELKRRRREIGDGEVLHRMQALLAKPEEAVARRYRPGFRQAIRAAMQSMHQGPSQDIGSAHGEIPHVITNGQSGDLNGHVRPSEGSVTRGGRQ